jgi:cytochrome c5
MRGIFILVAAAALISCAQPTSCAAPATKTDAAADASSAASQGDVSADAAATGGERFYGRERFSILSDQTGSETGPVTEHVREWGRRRAEIKDTMLTMMGIERRTHQRVIYDGARIATVDLDTGAVTVTTNPMYDQVVAAMRGRTGVEFGEEIMTQMGGRRTGERATIADHECEYWELPQLGARNCVTAWGGTLHTSVSLGPVSFERRAREVRMGDGGPDAAFEYDASRATQAPSLDDVRRKMQGG